MHIKSEFIKNHISSCINCLYINVQGKNKHFKLTIVSPIFLNKNYVERHKIIYSLLNEYIIENKIHALSIKTFTPEEFKN
ncbi:BolA family protein [Candidatus Profftella armatura]|nr:BolA/IbaG family iron-sulfur metabolism protein [Candidatus Profftella armatura]ALC96126.1 hypothetical protein AMC77_00765 [Candidatus Profftella armatura]QLK13752.1 BolA/IbaG family iron-sulfur metabolism protein [Candidatus Profftella armatura]